MKTLFFFGLLCIFCYPVHSTAESTGDQLLALHNQTRLAGYRCGLLRKTKAAQLRWNNTLADAAKSHARNMAKTNRLGHRVKGSLSKRLKRAGYHWSAYGENIAAGFTNAEQVLKAWLKSKEHCRNLLNPMFTEMGAAEHEGYWVVIFGTPLSDKTI